MIIFEETRYIIPNFFLPKATPVGGVSTPTGMPGAPTPVGGADTPGPVTMNLNPEQARDF